MDRPTLVAIIAAYNEEDIIGAAVGHLVEQGAYVYLLDDGSTDQTVDVAIACAGSGLIGVEKLPPLTADSRTGVFSLARILERKTELARMLDAGWFINHDADEFRESPWPHLSLEQAVQLVDRLGWNAIDFQVLNFVPGERAYSPGMDVLDAFRCCSPAADYDRAQVRCWKNTGRDVELVSTGGHETRFEGRRVFPIRFPMRHYPIRGLEHARRKVLHERLPRFAPEERARGWHRQYDGRAFDWSLTPAGNPGALYDRDTLSVAVQIENRLMETACPTLVPDPTADVAETVRQVEDDLARQSAHVEDLTLALEQRQRDLVAHQEAREETKARLKAALDRAAELEVTAGVLDTTARALQEELALVNRNASDVAGRLDEVFASRSWRVTRPLRAAWRLLGGR